ncbi:DUF7311 family protein [Halobaculum marinum]|uniref:DUF7311 domain-containing protein n=1 Tax=Halobaculum marinum TaxID=3031996 RepID=A0ABD5X3T2_9EURY|nr:hypothetical protein [Halobaculum sp. DT55]
MIRVVLAVAVAAVLFAAALPAVEQARVERTTAATERVAERVERAARALHTGEPARGPGAASVPTGRRVVSVGVPRRSLVAAGVSSLAVCPGPTDQSSAVVAAAVEGGHEARMALAGRYAIPDGGVVLSRPGTHRLVLELVRVAGADDGVDGARRVRISRVGSAGSTGGSSSTNPGPDGPCDSSTDSAAGATPTTATTLTPENPQTPVGV